MNLGDRCSLGRELYAKWKVLNTTRKYTQFINNEKFAWSTYRKHVEDCNLCGVKECELMPPSQSANKNGCY